MYVYIVNRGCCLEVYFSDMYLIVLETINQGTREHRCRYGHHAAKIK